jgi:hypothetical protein
MNPDTDSEGAANPKSALQADRASHLTVSADFAAESHQAHNPPGNTTTLTHHFNCPARALHFLDNAIFSYLSLATADVNSSQRGIAVAHGCAAA